MNLKDVEAKEAVIVYSDDPDRLGRIKVTCPGEFDTGTMDQELLPWVYPFNMTHFNAFTRMLPGAKVWLLKNKDNHNEYYYWPFFEEIQLTRDFLEKHYDDNPEVIFARDDAGVPALITFDSEEGIYLKVKEYYVNIRPNSDIIIHSTQVDMDIKDGHVWLGGTNAGGYEPIVMGNNLKLRLTALYNAMLVAASVLKATIIHAPVGVQFDLCAQALASGDPTFDALMLSKSCSVNIR